MPNESNPREATAQERAKIVEDLRRSGNRYLADNVERGLTRYVVGGIVCSPKAGEEQRPARARSAAAPTEMSKPSDEGANAPNAATNGGEPSASGEPESVLGVEVPPGATTGGGELAKMMNAAADASPDPLAGFF